MTNILEIQLVDVNNFLIMFQFQGRSIMCIVIVEEK